MIESPPSLKTKVQNLAPLLLDPRVKEHGQDSGVRSSGVRIILVALGGYGIAVTLTMMRMMIMMMEYVRNWVGGLH